METILSIFVGVGLSAACGFRIFVPPLIMSIAALSGHLELASGFEWIGSYYALAAFGAATVIEILGYYVPWVDNVLDAIATPAAVVAGAIVTASVIGDISPFLRWSLALIAGGGTAGIVQLATVLVRGASSLTTGGLGNAVVATGELLGSIFTTLLVIALPIVAILALAVIYFVIARKFGMLIFRKRQP